MIVYIVNVIDICYALSLGSGAYSVTVVAVMALCSAVMGMLSPFYSYFRVGYSDVTVRWW